MWAVYCLPSSTVCTNMGTICESTWGKISIRSLHAGNLHPGNIFHTLKQQNGQQQTKKPSRWSEYNFCELFGGFNRSFTQWAESKSSTRIKACTVRLAHFHIKWWCREKEATDGLLLSSLHSLGVKRTHGACTMRASCSLQSSTILFKVDWSLSQGEGQGTIWMVKYLITFKLNI